MLIKHKSFLICRCLYFELQNSFDFNVFCMFEKSKIGEFNVRLMAICEV